MSLSTNKVPLVVLVGRVNVGKSTLFNRIARTVHALALDYEGVTRDSVQERVSWNDVSFMLADTGGIDLKKNVDPIIQQVQKRVMALLDQAQVIVFVTDATAGATAYELELAKKLRKLKKTVIVAANKTDVKISQERIPELRKLGFEFIFPISAEHNRGISELLDYIVSLLPYKETTVTEQEHERSCRVALLGRPNVGKSSLMNALLQEERSIVTDVPGTTREAITEQVRFYAQTIELTDTAGVRKQKAIKEELEELMVKSSFAAVRTADIVVLVAQADDGRLTDQELKLAFYAFEQGKALIIAINKSDLLDVAAKEAWKYHFSEYDFFFKKIEIINLSCKTGERVGKLLPLVDKIWQRYQQQFSERELTTLFKQALLRRPLYRQEIPIQLKYAKQVRTAPPTIDLIINLPKLVGDSELSFFERILRGEYQLKSVPIVFELAKE